jgi:hypothetical protein
LRRFKHSSFNLDAVIEYRWDLSPSAPEGTPNIHQKVEGSVKQSSSELPLAGDGVDEAILPPLKAILLADHILNVLRDNPSGLTAKQVADQLGGTRSNIGSRLSKFAAYGIIRQSRGGTTPTASSGAIYTFPVL